MIVGNIGGGGGSYEIAKSLRLRSSASAYLSRTPASAGNRTTWTWAGWVKRGTVTSAAAQRLFAVDSSPSGGPSGVWISSTDTVNVVFSDDSGSNNRGTAFTGALRDPSAWYHLVVACDTSQALDVNKIKLFVNGSQFSGSAYGAGYPTLSMQGHINMARLHTIGQYAGIQFFDGYLSDVYFIDGQALGPNSFGNVDATTGQWVPKKYSGAYGPNGFYLPFNDGTNLTNLCLDRSGNGNNWTATGVSLTAGPAYDWMLDTPTNNCAVLNPLSKPSSVTHSDGNLKTSTSTGAADTSFASIPMEQGKYYAEMIPPAASGSYPVFGIDPMKSSSLSGTYYPGISSGGGGIGYGKDGSRYVAGSTTAAWGSAINANSVVGVAVDATAGMVWFSLDGVWQGGGNPATGSNPAATFTPGTPMYFAVGHWSGVTGVVFNFGQRPFASTPPTGFKSLCTQNLPAPVIPNPKKHFDVVSHAGSASSPGQAQTISGLQLQPDLVWVKDRSNANSHALFDSVRGVGANKELSSNGTTAEGGANSSAYGYLSAIGASSITYTAGSDATTPGAFALQNGHTYVDWLWKAGGAAVTNTAGSITSQVSANTTAGFSIVTYTGTGANATVGHGLGVAPKMVIIKNRGSIGTAEWLVGHSSIGFDNFLLLNSTQAQVTAANRFNNTSPTSSVFSIGAIPSANTETYVAYCFAEVPGFSKIGSYIGNGSSDGPFVYCGFKPAMVLAKRVDAAGYWNLWDSKRGNPFNVVSGRLYPDSSAAEDTFTYVDFVANGFKIRTTGDPISNASGGTYIFYAVAESPFNYSTAR